jgi:hypothetical protein
VIVMADDGGEKLPLARRPSNDLAKIPVAAGARPLIGKLAEQPASIAPRCLYLLPGRNGQ